MNGDGSQGGFVLPVGTVTLLLADVEGSVSLWEADHEAMTATVDVLDRLITDTVDRRGGVRPVEQGEGDSFVAAFSRASDAVACALDLQRATCPGQSGPAVRLRMGIHTGEVQLRDEGNYIGSAINRCARLRDIGHGGQVLVSRPTHDLVVDRLPEGADLELLGTFRLRDLARPEDVYQLRHPDLPARFPALRSLDALPNNLPVQLTSFIGRHREITAIAGLVTDHRLVTLTGSGGCGKTRLALQVAAELLDRHPNGVWWVDLAPIDDPALVPATVAAALGVKESPGSSVSDTLRRHVGVLRTQLVLDNCEQVVTTVAELVDDLLHHCPGVSVLATSRESLAVEGEVSFRVPSLSLPTELDHPGVESLSQCEAVHLFIERAQRVRPNFAVTNENAPAVAGICHRLDGIPLAIELAAARTLVMTPAQILAGLDDRFRLLAGGARTAVARQQTLRASVDWSFDLLTEDERTLLIRLAIFAGGFVLDAAEDVGAGEGIERIRVLELLVHLVDRSLVQVEETNSEAHYRLLETIRQYGREKLAGTDDESAVRNRHLRHHVGLARRAEAELTGPAQTAWLTRLDLQHDNMRAALDWSIQSGQVDDGLQICAGIWLFWLIRGHLTEGRQWIEALIAPADCDPLLRARALTGAGQLETYHGDLAALVTFATEALVIGREHGDEVVVGRALDTLGYGRAFLGMPDAAETFEEAIEVCRATEDTWWLSDALNGLAMLGILGGQLAAARPLLTESLAVARPRGNRNGQEVALAFLGRIRVEQGELDGAEVDLRDSLVIARELADGVIAAVDVTGLGYVAARRGRGDDATLLLDEGITLGREAGPQALVFSLVLSGLARYGLGDLDGATREMQEALELGRAMELAFPATLALRVLADVAMARGDLGAAGHLVSEALETSGPGGGWGRGLALEAAARLAYAQGSLTRAEDLHHNALAVVLEFGNHLAAVEVLESLTRIAADEERFVDAARLVGACEAFRQTTGAVRWRSEQPAHDETLARICAGITADELAQADDEGRGMTLGDAVAYATRGRGERGRPTSGWGAITPAEARVIALVGEGLSNPEIATRLFVSRRTVTTHLSHIYAKLGIGSRHQLAVAAAQHEAEELVSDS